MCNIENMLAHPVAAFFSDQGHIVGITHFQITLALHIMQTFWTKNCSVVHFKIVSHCKISIGSAGFCKKVKSICAGWT